MPQIVVKLGKEEQEALLEWSQKEYRVPRDQVRYLLRQILQENGYLEKFDEASVYELENTNDTKGDL